MRITGMGRRRALQILRSGDVRTVYATPSGKLRVAEWAVLEWQERRTLNGVRPREADN